MLARCIFSLTWLAVLVAPGGCDEQAMKLPACVAKLGECDDNEGSVCGTDGQTYHTKCHLLRAQCSGHQVSLKYRGSCNACLEAVKYARRQRQRNPSYFVPKCRKDGNYAAMQCMGKSNCWCTDSMGNPIADTESMQSRRGKPRCRAHRLNRNRRRLASHQISYNADTSSSKSSSEGGGPGAHRACNKADRTAFNNNLMRAFRSEAIKSGRPPTLPDSALLDWMFSKLDTNGNQLLDRQEVRELKKMKRSVKPRRCGRAFGKYCDVTKDENLSRLEWSTCLAKELHNRTAIVNILASSSVTTLPQTTHYRIHGNHRGRDRERDHTNTNIISHPHSFAEDASGSDETEDNYEDTGYGGEDEDSDGSLPAHSHSLNPSLYMLNSKTETTSQDTETEPNCWMDKEVTMEEQAHGGKSRFYVPECMPDGRYQRIQCYSSTPYCWCVNEDTGKSIPGTLMKNKQPQCDEEVVVRPMKGCTEPRKTQFLKDLKLFLMKLLPSSATGSNSTVFKTEDERIAMMSFVYLDKNKNKLWERKEWKVFRDLVTSASNLRRCGKKMPRYCDVNGDKKISLAEWLNCLQSFPRAENATTPKPAQSNETASPKLQGSNPLEKYLKD
ncbi:hypothetical protein KR009_010161 [Drosophila setifemur]|nr:hypothetical protein KR009_010161 [Drosophila setifemur]